jgi:hypothetical protein
MKEQAVIERVRRWIAGFVIALDLCPFANRVFDGGRIRYVVSEATDVSGLLADLERELRTLIATPIDSIETTLLIHPHVLGDFLDYNDFLGEADQLLGELGLVGTIQIASFHPEYQFAGTKPAAVENYTNRSPYPMLHLLREASVTAVAADVDALREIPRRNIATMRRLGLAAVRERFMRVWTPDGSQRLDGG